MALDVQVGVITPGGILFLESATSDLVSVSKGDRVWRRHTVEGRYQHGRALIGAVLSSDTLNITVRFKGSSLTAAMNAYQAAVAAFSQHSYSVVVEVEGWTTTYWCEPADVSAPLEKFRAMADLHEATFSVPVDPGGL